METGVHRPRWKPRRAVCWLWLLALLAMRAEATEREKRVLVFVPEYATVPAIADSTRGVRRTLMTESPGPVTVHVEYLGMAWFGSGEYERALSDFYRVKYREQQPDALVVYEDATPLLLQIQRELWPRVPMLAIVADDFQVESFPQGPYLRGNWADFDITGSVRAALRLMPDTRNVALVLGSSPREKIARALVTQEVRRGAPDRVFIDLAGLTLEELRRRVRTLPPDTLVMMVGFMQDATGRSLISYDVMRMLHADGAPPLFSVHKTMLGSGIVGGVLVDYPLLGQKTARRVLRLLQGEPASSLPTGSMEANVLAFDARELERWHIPASRLPPEAEVHFHEPGPWERYRWQVSALLGVGLLKAGLIAVLLLERSRRKRAQRLNLAVLDSLPGSVAILDRHGSVLRANPARDGGPGESAQERLPTSGGSYLESLREAARTGPPEVAHAVALLEAVLAERLREGLVEFRGHSPGTWLELRVRHLELPEGGAVASLVDVTSRKRAEQEARQARDERAHLERVAAVGELGVSLAHELNQPLAAILTNAQTAQRLVSGSSINAPLLREVLQDIVADDLRASAVIRHLRMLLKKDEAGHARHDFNALVRDVLRLVGNDALLRGADLIPDLCEGALPILGNGVQLQQVVLNLTVNALDAVGPSPSGARRVWVRTQRHGDRVELVVEDTGEGMTDEVLARLGEPFFTTKREGMGMGLSISRSLLEAHHGRLHAERRAGGGSLFHCTLPLQLD